MNSFRSLIESLDVSALDGSNFMSRGAVKHGKSVRRRPTGGNYVPPSHLYLVYISMDEDEIIVRHLEKDINPADVEREENELIKEAVLRNNNVSNFELIRFKKPSFFTIVLDEDNWDFYYPAPTVEDFNFPEYHDPVIFLDEKAIILEQGSNYARIPKPFAENHAFYNLLPLTKRIRGEFRQAIRCTNYFTKENGDLIDTTVDYSFNIEILIPFSKTDPSSKLRIVIDPDGQNQGPP